MYIQYFVCLFIIPRCVMKNVYKIKCILAGSCFIDL